MNREEYVFGEEEPDHIFDRFDCETYEEMNEVPAAAIEFYRRDRGAKGAPA